MQPHKPLTPWPKKRPRRGPFCTKLGFETGQPGIQKLDFRERLLKQDKPPSIKEKEALVLDYKLLKINLKIIFQEKWLTVGPKNPGGSERLTSHIEP
jgi:hypothetical protein